MNDDLPLTGIGPLTRHDPGTDQPRDTSATSPGKAADYSGHTQPLVTDASPLEIAMTGNAPRLRQPRAPRNLRSPKTARTGSGKLGERISAARRQPGFVARSFTLLVIDAIWAFVSTQLLIGPALAVGLVILLMGNLLLFKKALDDAYRPPLEAPDDKRIPKEGWPKLWYWLMKRYGHPERVPQPTAKQQLNEEINLLEDWIRALYRYVQPVIWVGNGKGNAAKSFQSVIMGKTLGKVLKQCRIVLLVTSAEPSTATPGALSGLKETLNVRQYYNMVKEGKLPHYKDLYRHAHTTADGLTVVQEELGGSTTEEYFSEEEMSTIIKDARDKADIVILDTGNDGPRKSSVTIAALKLADVAVFSAFVGAPQTVHKVGANMARYLGHAMLSRENGAQPKLRDMIVNAPVVFHGVQPDEDLSKYRQDYLHIGQAGHELYQGPVAGVRWDDYLNKVVEGLDIEEMNRATYRDHLVVTGITLREAARLQEIEVPECHPAVRNLIARTSTSA